MENKTEDVSILANMEPRRFNPLPPPCNGDTITSCDCS
jgi:hypothetical protein